MSVAQIEFKIKEMKCSGFFSAVTPFLLGRRAAMKGMQPQRHWPLDMVIGWDNANGATVRFSEEALANTGWREDMDVDYPQPEVQ